MIRVMDRLIILFCFAILSTRMTLATEGTSKPDISSQCLDTTSEFGEADRKDGVELVSHIKDVLEVGDQIMFMRTSDVFVCHSA